MQAVIFDMDGVVIDSQPVADRLLVDTAREFGAGLSESEMQQLVGASGRDFWRYVKTTYGLPFDVEHYLQQYNVDDEIAAYRGLEPILGVRLLIDDLLAHGVRLGLATTASRKRMDAVLDIFELRHAFAATTSDDEVSRSKPNPEVYLLATRKLGVRPHDCVAIEDSTRGVEAAKSAGMKCVQYVSRSGAPTHTADLVISDLRLLSYDRLMVL